jgi:serine/threonine protein kinase
MQVFCNSYKRDYIKQALISSGTSGSVYCVENRLFNTYHAAKFYNNSSFYDIDDSVIQECNMLRINNRYVIRPDVIYLGKKTVIIYPLLKEDMRTWIAKKYKMLSTLQIINVMLQLLEAVHSIHATGIIHRDLKPRNIMMDENNNVCIIDFGLSVFANHAPILRRNNEVQTLNYRAPEAFPYNSAKSYTEKIDIWSLGCIFAELFTGISLFRGTDTAQIYSLVQKFNINYWQNCIPKKNARNNRKYA